MNYKTSSSDIFDDQQRRNLLLDKSADLKRKKNQSYHGIYPPAIPDSFKEYLSQLDLPGELRYIVLSSSSHYYYEPDELKGVHAVLNLKQLNHINQLDEFLKSTFCILSTACWLAVSQIAKARTFSFHHRKRQVWKIQNNLILWNMVLNLGFQYLTGFMILLTSGQTDILQENLLHFTLKMHI